jgi:arabinan endo-1,5-alpha-L-arabinosidase
MTVMMKRLLILSLMTVWLVTGCSQDKAVNDTHEVDEIIDSSQKSEKSENSELDKELEMAGEEHLKTFARDFTESEAASFTFLNTSVHDPSVVKVDDTFYIFGSHLASAKSTDLINWTTISSSPRPNNPLFPEVDETLSEALAWAETNTFWAPDASQLPDGKFYFYYNACRGDSPLSALGVARADAIDGPYEDLGIFLKSGMWGQTSADGKVYDANFHPNVVDPHNFFDAEGKYWMVYGSYSGGIFIMEMNPETGFPLEGQGYGKKLLGAYHARIEGPYILYSPETEYYYLFLSYGGLDRTGGYNMRVARSKNPDGPYLDSQGQDMIDAKGKNGQIFHDPSYAPYGYKIMGNFQYSKVKGENASLTGGYISPGHNSAYFEASTGKYYLIFHARFPMKGEQHQVRVHQFFMNEAGWPVVAPYRYVGETIAPVNANEVTGTYKFIDHGKDISADIKYSRLIALLADGSVIDESQEGVVGSWQLTNDYTFNLTMGEMSYSGVFLKQYDEDNKLMTMTFTAASVEGTAVWGSQLWLK